MGKGTRCPGPAYRVPGQEGPSPQGQVGHELNGQASAAVPGHHLGVAMGSGHVQDEVGPVAEAEGHRHWRRGLKGQGPWGWLTAGSEEAPPWLSGSSQSRTVCRGPQSGWLWGTRPGCRAPGSPGYGAGAAAPHPAHAAAGGSCPRQTCRPPPTPLAPGQMPAALTVASQTPSRTWERAVRQACTCLPAPVGELSSRAAPQAGTGPCGTPTVTSRALHLFQGNCMPWKADAL